MKTFNIPAFLALLLIAESSGCGRGNEGPSSSADGSQKLRVVSAVKSPPPTGGRAAAEGRVPVYELKMAPSDLAALERTAFENTTYPASFIAGGVSYTNVRVRFRGDWARTWPKKPLKILFDHDQLFEGRRCLNLNSGWRDPAFVREVLAFHVFAACGVPSPRARMARVNMNGHFRGLYVEVEQPDKEFLARLNLRGASLYKAVSGAHYSDERDLSPASVYAKHYKKETQKQEGAEDLQTFCHGLAQATNVAAFFSEHTDLDSYVNYLAAMILAQNWDCFNKNHFLLYDGGGSRKWSVVPWDLDRTFGDHWQGSFTEARLPIRLGTKPLPGPTGWNRMEARFFSDPPLERRLFERLGVLLQTEFTAEKLFPVLDQLEADIREDAAMDRARWPGGTNPDLKAGIAQLKNYIQHRRAFLLKELANTPRS